MLTEIFRCPACKGSLRAVSSRELVCQSCGEAFPIQDGVVDFVQGRFDATLDSLRRDPGHRITGEQADAFLDRIRRAAGPRWPNALGRVVEVGCGDPGLFSRALLAREEAREIVLTDVSAAALRRHRQQLDRDELLTERSVAFAARGSQQACFHDVVFDTCVGASVLHRVADVRGFLADIFRALKPGGRVFLVEPSRRFRRALMQSLADVLALLYARERDYSADRQVLLNLVAQARRTLLHQGDVAFLSQQEDRHLFDGEAIEDMALDLGFARAETVQVAPDRSGAATVRRLCEEAGASEPFRQLVTGQVASTGGRHMALLSDQDSGPDLLFCLAKGAGPRVHAFQAKAAPPALLPPGSDLDIVVGGVAPRWSMDLEIRPATRGVSLTLSGWCLVNADAIWVRVTLGGIARQAPVWVPRPDVHLAVNTAGLYAAWNALCCGVQADLPFDDLAVPEEGATLAVDIILGNGAMIHAPAPPRLRLEQKILIAQ